MTNADVQKDRPFIVRTRDLGLKAGIKETLEQAPLAELLKTHNVQASELEFRSKLEDALSNYVRNGAYAMHQAIKAKAMPRKRRLQKMAKLAEKLKAEYDYFYEDLDHFVQMCAASEGISVAHSDEKHPGMKATEESLNTPIILSQLLKILPDAIAYELGWKHPDIPGRPKEKGLQDLILSLGNFWEKHQGSEFTVDHHAGAAISDALAFVRDTILAVEDIPETAIVTAARTVRSKMIAHKNLDENEIPF